MKKVRISNNLGKVYAKPTIAGFKINARISRNLASRSVSNTKVVSSIVSSNSRTLKRK